MSNDISASGGKAPAMDEATVSSARTIRTGWVLAIGFAVFALCVSPVWPYGWMWTLTCPILLLFGGFGSWGLAASHGEDPERSRLIWFAVFQGMLAAGLAALSTFVIIRWVVDHRARPDFCEGDGCFVMDDTGWVIVLALFVAAAIAFLVFSVLALIKARRTIPARRTFLIACGVFRILMTVCCLLPCVAFVLPGDWPIGPSIF